MPTPTNDIDSARWEHTRLRRNVLGGTWEMDILWRMKEQYGLNQVANMGRPSLAVNLMANSVDQTAILYDAQPVVSNPGLTGPATTAWADVVDGCHLWNLLQDNCRKVVGLREGFVQVLATPAGVQLEVVTPDEIVVDKTTGDASTITAMRRSRRFVVVGEKGEPVVKDCWELWDISDPLAPVHAVVQADGTIITADVYPPAEGADGLVPHTYPWVDEMGPYLPWTLYRARYTSETFDPYYGSELVHGTLDIAIHWTMWGVCLRNNSWPQWWIMDADVPGMSIADASMAALPSPPDTIELAPNSILRFKSDGNPGVGKVGQLQPADARTMADAILTKQNTILNNVGIHPDDLTPTTSSSGVAIQLKRSAQRRVALSYVPSFRAADERLFSLMARTNNLFYEGAVQLPVEGWRIDYTLPETSSAEFLADFEKDKELVALGFKSMVDVAMKLYGLDTPGEALDRLEEVQRMNAMLAQLQSMNSAPKEGAPPLALTATDLAGIVTVNEARNSVGLPPEAGEDGLLTVAQYQAKYASVVAAAAQAASGIQPDATVAVLPPEEG